MGDIIVMDLSRNPKMPTATHTPHRKWTFRVTNTADYHARLDEARLPLRSQAPPTAACPHSRHWPAPLTIGSPDGQGPDVDSRWPTPAALPNICVS